MPTALDVTLPSGRGTNATIAVTLPSQGRANLGTSFIMILLRYRIETLRLLQPGMSSICEP